MSVRQWKRVITLTVIITIVLLLTLTIVFCMRSCQYISLIEDGKLIDLTQDGAIDEDELSGFFKYLEDVENNSNAEYQDMFPSLYIENDFQFISPSDDACYLTFDDGPNETNTSAILDILKENNIKATFFVSYDTSESAKALYKRIVKEGHTIGVYTDSHNNANVYSSVEAFLTNFEKTASYIEEVTGVKPEIFRFPGGSINIYNKHNYQEIITEMVRRGYVYYDWNVSSGDASVSYITSEDIVENVLLASEEKDSIILLMHDGNGHSATVAALPEVINTLKNQGYKFYALDNSVTPYTFGY